MEPSEKVILLEILNTMFDEGFTIEHPAVKIIFEVLGDDIHLEENIDDHT